jgi:hypothetical protein
VEFMVSRTSLWIDVKPCEEAVKKSYTKIDERPVDSPANLKIGPDRVHWYTEGFNHRVEDGHIKRDFEAEAWFVEINSLEELIAFQNKYGDLVLQKSYDNPSILKIEIYDTYRE